MVREVVGNRGLMQTFLPFADFEMSARSLDTKCLGKQPVECIQVVRGLVVSSTPAPPPSPLTGGSRCH